MNGKRVDELPSAMSLNLGDYIPILNNGVLRKTLLQTMFQRVIGTLTSGTYRSVRLTVGSEGTITGLENGVLRVTEELDFGSISAGAEAELTITVPGASVGDPVCTSLPAAFNTGLALSGAWVTDSNEVTIRIRNTTSGSINPDAADFTVAVFLA